MGTYNYRKVDKISKEDFLWNVIKINLFNVKNIEVLYFNVTTLYVINCTQKLTICIFLT